MISESINNNYINFQDDNKQNEMQISSLLHDHDDNNIATEEDILELEQYLNNENIDSEDLKLKASKLIKLVKIKERDLLLAAQIGQSLLDANINMQKQLKLISSNEEEKSVQKYEEPKTNQTTTTVSSFNQPISRTSSYDISSYTDNLEEVNSKLQDQVEKLEQSMKQNEKQNTKRIQLLENLLEQLQTELVELQSMNSELENEKKMLLEERLSSKKIVETNEENTDSIIAQLLVHKKKLVRTVNDLENKKRYLEDELLHALNDESKLERELRKLKREAEAGNRFKELYKQQSIKVNELESSIINYRKNVRRISMGIFDVNNECSKYPIQEGEDISDEDETSTLISKSNIPSSGTFRQSPSSMSRENSLISYQSLEDELDEIKEGDDDDDGEILIEGEREGKGSSSSLEGDDNRRFSQGSTYYDYEDQREEMGSDYYSADLSNNGNENLSIISRKSHYCHHYGGGGGHRDGGNCCDGSVLHKSDLYSKNGSGVIVLQGRINETNRGRRSHNHKREKLKPIENIEGEGEVEVEIDHLDEEGENHNNNNNNNNNELILREKKCYKCGKPVSNVPVPVRTNHFSHHHHQGKNRRSHSRVMRARAKRTAISRKRQSVLVPIKSTREEDEEQLTIIDTNNTSFLGIYNSCKAALERMDYSKLEVSKSHTAWKFIQFWFAMLCIFVGCIVVSYRRVFQKNAAQQAADAKARKK